MGFESMDYCSRTVKGGSRITCNGLLPPGRMAPTRSNQEPSGSSHLSTPTASIAATTVPFQWPRFGTISDRCGRLLRTLQSTRCALPIIVAITAAIAWGGHLATIPFSMVAPILIYYAKSRTHAYASAFAYYAAASWPITPGVRAFLG